MQQFYILKMMMLIISIIVMCLYLYSLCMVCRDLNNKGQVSVIVSNRGYAIWKTILRNLNYVQYLNIAPMDKAWFMAPMEYSPNGKYVMAPMEYIPKFNSPNGKGMVLWTIIFRSGNGHVKRQRCQKNLVLCTTWSG